MITSAGFFIYCRFMRIPQELVRTGQGLVQDCFQLRSQNKPFSFTGEVLPITCEKENLVNNRTLVPRLKWIRVLKSSLMNNFISLLF